MSVGPDTEASSPPGSLDATRRPFPAWIHSVAGRLRALGRRPVVRVAGVIFILVVLFFAGTGWDFRGVPAVAAAAGERLARPRSPLRASRRASWPSGSG